MAKENTSLKLKTELAHQFKNSFIRSENKTVGYIFLSKTLPNANDEIANDVADTVSDDKLAWDSMFAAKKIIPGNIEFVIPRVDWQANNRYKQYDDKANLADLLTTTVSGDTVIYPMYVMNSQGDVYKCICNNRSSLSTIEPTGDYTTSNGFITTESSGVPSYMWKYMYNVKKTNKFLTDNWMPVPYSIEEIVPLDYDMSTQNFIDGGLNKIAMTNTGTGYVHTTYNVAGFSSGSNYITVTDANIDNVALNMAVEGEGILTGTYVTTISTEQKRIYLSDATISSGGNSNTVTVKTRVHIDGDGTGVISDVRLSNTSIIKIDVTTIGTGYSKANITIYGTGTGAKARAILPPKFGHGFKPAVELGANNLMFVVRVGEVDSTEGGKISSNTSFRQYGLLVNPHKYGNTSPVSYNQANSVISQTLNMKLFPGTGYLKEEEVYQGTADKKTFVGYVQDEIDNVIRIVDYYGTVSTGGLLTGANSGIKRAVEEVYNPEFEKYTGEIIYTKNITKVERTQGQAEEVKLIVKF